MAVRKLKNSWWVDFHFDGRRHRKRSPENTRQGALAYELLLRQKLARGEPLESHPHRLKDQTFAEFAAKWLDDYVRANNKHSEQLKKKHILSASLIPFFGSMPIWQITAHDIERYKAQQVLLGLKNKTIMNRLLVLNKCIVTAYEWLALEGAPPKIKWPKWVVPEIDYLAPQECELLVSHASGVTHEMILMALRTGMRQGELKGLQWSSIDWLTRTVAVRHSRDDYQGVLVPPKNNRTRHIPLDIDVYTMLYRRKQDTGYVFLTRDGQPFNNNRLYDAIVKVCTQAGLRKIGWHTLRHTFASHLAMRGVPLPAIKELMGHANITTTMRYAHVAPSTLRTAIEMLNPKTMATADFGQPVVNQWQKLQRDEVAQENPSTEYA
jgi:integrase